MVLLGIIISYLLGSIPTAYIFGRILKGIDIRKFGSGNVGATNAFRLLGLSWGVVVLVLDILKGLISVTLLANYFLNFWDGSGVILRIIFGIACICGHNWSIFLQLKGGKGVATSLGILTGLGITVTGLRLIISLVILIWLIVFLAFRIVSLASVLSAISLPLFMFIFNASKELLILGIILSIIIILRHKKNLSGLFRGKEHPLSPKGR